MKKKQLLYKITCIYSDHNLKNKKGKQLKDTHNLRKKSIITSWNRIVERSGVTVGKEYCIDREAL